MTVGDRIKNRRIELGLTQEDLALRMGYKGKSSVCAAESCGDNVTTTKVKKFAAALGVSDRYLMGWEDDTEVLMDVTTGSEKTKKAVELYDRVMSLPPADQTALLTLLESLQKKP